MLKKHNLVPVIFYAELNNFSRLQSCNLLYLYVAQISCLTLAQRVLTVCKDSTCCKMQNGLVFYSHFHPLSLSQRLIVGYDSIQLHNYSVCSEDNALHKIMRASYMKENPVFLRFYYINTT